MTSKGKFSKSVPSSAASSPSTEIVGEYNPPKSQAEVNSLSASISTNISYGKQLLPKAYCHGGDVAFFGGIDLEFEGSINNALYGHSSGGRSRKKSQIRFVPDLSFASVEASVSRHIGKRDLKSNPRYIAAIQRALSLMLINLLERCVTEKEHMAKMADSANGTITSISTVLDSSSQMGIRMIHLLSTIQNMNDFNDLPVHFTHHWEQKVIDKAIDEGRIKLGI